MQLADCRSPIDFINYLERICGGDVVVGPKQDIADIMWKAGRHSVLSHAKYEYNEIVSRGNVTDEEDSSNDHPSTTIIP